VTTLLQSDALLAEVEGRLEAFFDVATARATRHSPHYRELWRELRSAAAGGKRLRPRLVITAYLHLGGGPLQPAIDLATAIELLHTALLLHDDVIDGDLERRGAPNLVGSFAAAGRRAGLTDPAAERWGESAAILAGDLLLTAAVRLTAGLDLDRQRRDRLVDLLDESIFRAAAGELADVAYASGLGTPSADEIRDMMADKTAHYSLELPLRAGAILAGAEDELGDRLGSIGRSLGLVFQMRDDLLGVFGESAETGKSASNDLREGKQTMLVAYARGTDAWASTADLFGSETLEESDAQRLRDALERSGARARFEDEIRRERDDAIRLVQEAGLPAALADLLSRETLQAAERWA
jgi:geranylgeranyl diphosphate synthase type II